MNLLIFLKYTMMQRSVFYGNLDSITLSYSIVKKIEPRFSLSCDEMLC